MKTSLSLAACLAVSAGMVAAQCGGTTITVLDGFTRTTGNQVMSIAEGYVTGTYADTWTVAVSAQVTLNGSSLHSGASAGDPGTEQVWYDTLSTTGPGTFALADQYLFSSSCGDNIPYSFTDRNIVISLPTITPPSSSYGSGYYAFWYFNGIASPDGYPTTALLSGNGNFGTCSPGSVCVPSNPTYNWQVIDRSGAVSFNTTSAVSTTITSQTASRGSVYDVSVVFSIDGFSSPKLWLNLDTPAGMYASSTSQESDPDGCPGYDKQYHYVTYDLWSDALTPITINEKNDQFVPDAAGIVGWYLGAWESDAVWTPLIWDDQYHFTDHLYATNCDGTWNPHPVAPQGLNSLVFHVPQGFYVGSGTTQSGAGVRNDTQSFYTDHGVAQ